MPDDALQRFVDAVAEALTNGQPAGVASRWEVPALVVSDEGSRGVSTLDEVEAFFAQSIPWYNERGIVSVRGELLESEKAGERLAWATVRWPGFDEAGNENWSEMSRYLLRRGDDGEYRVLVAMPAWSG